MQVLVALAHPASEVVSNDELIRRCWDGLSISDDAIRRCIAQLRRLAESFAEPPFEIHTVSGVGYRLAIDAPIDRVSPEAALQPPHERKQAAWVGAGAIGVALAAVTLALVVRPGRSPPSAAPLVAVRPLTTIGDDPRLKPLAARTSDAIAGLLGDAGVRLAAGPTAKAPLAFEGAISSAADGLRLRLLLVDTRSRTSVWSREFAERADREDALVDAARGAALETMHLVGEADSDSASPLDPATLQLAVEGGESLTLPALSRPFDAVRAYEEALRRRPDSGALRAHYAYALSQLAFGSPAAENALRLHQARAEAERVIREHPGQAGMAWLALAAVAQAEAPHDWLATEQRLNAALKAAPQEPFVHEAKCEFLLRVGRAHDAYYYCTRALALRPLTGAFLLTNSQVIDLDGEFRQLADRDLESGARLYPDYTSLQIYRFAREAFGGSPNKALRLLHDADTLPPLLSADDVVELDALEKARKTGSKADADEAMAMLRRASANEPVSDSRFLFPMALGRVDDAFAAAKDLSLTEGPEAELLTFGFAAPLRRDARFWPLAGRMGLTRYWLATNKWPDFCGDPTYPLDCHAQARRVETGTP